ncbi:hypothetical protein SAMN05428959_106368 [Duganella sp. CF517]|uniref:hypothetical protein n=1 Tax=Duganella sp. CF517 TaxID=1881038 RepID=UPI0008CAAFA8|nr:hypothetical protein [Duganella sp. CF517]SEO33445.1 hypothetical protein SAMN05428959_106368 [Duganella sp. CF517]
MTRTIGIYVYGDVEVPDFAGPYDVFTCATLDGRQLAPHNCPAKTAAGAAFPELRVQGKRRSTGNGAVIASAGVATGIDLSPHLVGRLAGRELALATARQMDNDWSRP